MAGWEPEPAIGHHGTEKGRAAALEGRGDDGAVAIAGEAVGDDAGNDDAGAVAGEAFDQGGDRLALARGVDHQHHRQAKHGG